MIHSTSSAGAAAIRESIIRVYGDIEAFEFKTIDRWEEGGNDPLDAFSVHRSNRERAHWHYVSYGFTDLEEKENDDLVSSGYGFELTFRMVRKSEDVTPPIWPMQMMQQLARYVFHSDHPFEVGDVLELGRSIAPESKIVALVFAIDAELEEVRTAFGHVKFLQLVGLTQDDVDRAKRDGASSGVVDALRDESPLMIADV